MKTIIILAALVASLFSTAFAQLSAQADEPKSALYANFGLIMPYDVMAEFGFTAKINKFRYTVKAGEQILRVNMERLFPYCSLEGGIHSYYPVKKATVNNPKHDWVTGFSAAINGRLNFKFVEAKIGMGVMVINPNQKLFQPFVQVNLYFLLWHKKPKQTQQ